MTVAYLERPVRPQGFGVDPTTIRPLFYDQADERRPVDDADARLLLRSLLARARNAVTNAESATAHAGNLPVLRQRVGYLKARLAGLENFALAGEPQAVAPEARVRAGEIEDEGARLIVAARSVRS